MIPLFLDTETTGINKEDRICQIAFRCGDRTVNQMFNPTLPIKIEAMATHHITNKMIAHAELFVGSEADKLLTGLLKEETVLVAHNAKFDIEMLNREFIEVPRHICTYKVARHLDPNGKIPSYGLQYLRYFMGLEVEATAHDAMGDIIILEMLFDRLSKKLSMEEMIEISSKPCLIRTFTFGKHKDKTIESVAKIDRGYLEWLLAEKTKEDMPDEDWIYTLNNYLK